MKKIKLTFSSYAANKMLKGDMILLQTVDKSSKKMKEFVVEIKKIVSDIPRCNGCTVRLDNRQSYKYAGGTYCLDCYRRRVSKRKEK